MTNPGRRVAGTPRAGNPGGTFEQMQAVLRSQEAANEATRQTMQEVSIAMNGIMNSMDSMLNPVGSNTQPYGSGPHGGRPTMNGNQTNRPSYAYSPVGGYGTAGQGLGGIRRSVMGGLDQRLGVGSGSRFEAITDRSTGQALGHREYRTDGSVVTHGADWASTPEGAAALRGASSRGLLSHVLGSFGEGGAIGGARAIPLVGEALMAGEGIKEGLTMVGNQRAANAGYQSIYGGSNLSGMGQRFDQFGYQLGNLFGGGMTWGQSQQAFQSVSSLGLQGGARNNDLDFIKQNYMQMGVSVSDSFKLIQSATSDLNTSLTGLHQSLVSTRNAASATGQNANLGQQILTSNLNALGGAYTSPTGGVTQLAGVLSSLQAGSGRDMSGISLASMLTNPSILQQLGPNVGADYSTFQGMINTGSPAVITALMRQVNKGLTGLTSNQNFTNFVSQAVQRAGGVNGLDRNTVANIANQALMRSDQLGLNVQTAQSALASQTGINFNSNQTISQAIDSLTHTGNFDTNSIRNYGLETPYYSQNTSLLHRLGTDFNNFAGPAGRIPTGSDGHFVNPVIDAARQNSDIANAGIEVKDAKGNTRVMTLDQAIREDPASIAKGTAIVASTGQTVSQMLGGQHQKYYLGGSASHIKSVEGQMAADSKTKQGRLSQQLSHAYGLATVANLGHLSDGGPTAAQLADIVGHGHGVSKREFGQIQAYVNQKNPKSDSSLNKDSKGKITVSLSPEAAALFNFNGSGNIAVANSAAQTGSLPSPGLPGS